MLVIVLLWQIITQTKMQTEKPKCEMWENVSLLVGDDLFENVICTVDTLQGKHLTVAKAIPIEGVHSRPQHL